MPLDSDDPTTRRPKSFVMQKAIEKHGFKTAAAENGEEGVRKAKAMKPDLIFMDHRHAGRERLPGNPAC